MSIKGFFTFFWRFSLYLAGIILIFAFLLPYLGYGESPLLKGFYLSTGLFYILTIVSTWLVLRNADKPGLGYLNSFLLGMVVKMVLSLVFFLLLYKDFQGWELGFAVVFFTAYIVCTVFEVIYLMGNLRQI